MATLADTVARGKALRDDMNIVFAQALVGVVHRSEVRKARRLWEAWCIDNGETLLAALAALSSPAAPGKDEVGEALSVYCDICEVDRYLPCIDMTSGDPALYPHPERARKAALAARGERGE